MYVKPFLFLGLLLIASEAEDFLRKYSSFEGMKPSLFHVSPGQIGS